MPAQWQTWPCALPRTVPEACPPIGNDEALRMEGFFASCGPPPARNELHGESSTRAHPNHRTCLTETGARHTGPLYGISLPRQGSPQPEYSGPRFRPASLSPPLRAYHEAATAGQPHESLLHRCPESPNTPSLPDIRTRRSSARRASRPAACLQPLSRSSPDGSASSLQEGPVPYFQRYSSGPEASASEKKLRHLLSPVFLLPPPGPMTRHVLSSQPPANDGDRRPT